MPGIKFKVSTQGANEIAARFGKTWRDFDGIVEKRMNDAGEFMVSHIYQRVALKDEGTLSEGIGWSRTGKLTIVITGEAIAESGFDYFNITRFGHEGMIFPSHGFMGVGVLHFFSHFGARRSSSGTHFPKAEVFATFTRGFHPATDWVDKGTPAAREVVRRTGRLIARDIMQSATSST